MALTDRVKQILSWYSSDNPGTLTNLARLLNHGTLAGTGKLVILPVDQGFEHGPARSFAPNPAALRSRLPLPARDRRRLQRLRGAARLPRGRRGQVRRPDPAHPQAQQLRHARQDRPALLGDHRLGRGRAPPRLRRRSATRSTPAPACATGCTRTSASSPSRPSARASRSSCGATRAAPGLSKEGETAIDVCAYAAQIAAQLGAHVIKVKPPKAHIEQDEAKKVFEKYKIPIETLTERVRHVVQAPSTASASSSSRAARRRTPTRCSTR